VGKQEVRISRESNKIIMRDDDDVIGDWYGKEDNVNVTGAKEKGTRELS